MMIQQRSPVNDREVRCQGCGGWLASVPDGTTWARARCIKRGCTLYGVGQTVQLPKSVVDST